MKKVEFADIKKFKTIVRDWVEKKKYKVEHCF